MRILHLLADLPLAGGLSKSVPSLCAAEQRQGMEVTLVSRMCVLPPAAERAKAAGVVIVGYRPTPPQFLYFSWDMLRHLACLVAQADVVHVHSQWTFPVWWGCWLALRYKKILVMSPRGCLDPVRLNHSRWKKRLVGWMDRWLLRRASIIHATCEAEAGWVRVFLEPQNPQKCAKVIVVVPNGVDFLNKDPNLIKEL